MQVREHALSIRGQAVLLSRKLGLADRGAKGGRGGKEENLTDLIARSGRSNWGTQA